MAAARQRQQAAGAALLGLVSALLLAHVVTGQGEPNAQGQLVYGLGKWLTADDMTTLSSWGWNDGGSPCSGWTGVTCNAEGYVSSIDLADKGLKGSLPTDPALWSGLTGLTSINLSGNSLGGSVPAAITAAGPQLTSINVAGNPAMCGGSPAGVVGDASLASPCAPPTANTTEPVAANGTTAPPSLAANTTEPAPLPAANTTEPAPAPAANDTATTPAPVAPVVPAPAAAPPSPSPSPVIIKNAPICSCALKGFGSEDCAAAVASKCASSSPPPMCGMGDVTKDEQAAAELGSYLANECFTGQAMDTSVCTCVQNLLGNDCAKARVGLCVKKDPLCLPFQNIIDSNGSSSADAVSTVAPFLDDQCPVAEPKLPGVKATMEFPDLSMGQYITRQYTQNVANALSSVTGVPSTSISTLDVRPFINSSGGRRRARALLMHAGALRGLLQASGNGVQATYFLQTDDPAGVSQKLSTAAGDGTLSTKLSQYGITAQAGGLKVQSFLPPPPPPAGGGSSGSSGFPMWALAPIIIGSLLLLGALAALIWCCCCRKRARKERKAKKSTAAPLKAAPVAVGGAAIGAAAAHSDSSRDRDTLPKTYDYAPAPVNTVYTGSFAENASSGASYKAPHAGSGISPGAAAVGVGAAAAAAGVGAVALSKSTSHKSSAADGDLPVSRSMRVASPDGYGATGPDSSAGGLTATNSSTLTPWEAGAAGGDAAAAAAPARGSSPATLSHLTSLAPVRTSVPGTASSGGASTGALAAGAVGAGALAGAGLGAAAAGHSSSGGASLQPQDSSGSAWKSNVRPTAGVGAAGAAAGGAAATSSMAGGKNAQQAERAKFWAQFQETWQQVRQNQNMNDEPGTPSSGTNWTDNTGAVSPRK